MIAPAAKLPKRICLPVWIACLLVLYLASSGGTWAQSLDRLDANQPVALVADKITYDSRTGRVTASGAVQVFHGERTLTADQITYDNETGRIAAQGSIVLRDPTGTTVFANTADLDADLVDGLVQGARSVMGEHIRLAAVEARRVNERYNTLSKAVYSPCKVCPEDPTPLWRIRARRVIHDEQERVIHYENAYFDVLGIPIAWLPYFRHPDPTVKRASGFLTPSFLSSSTFGYGLKQPYFWVIDDFSDFTISPFVTTNDGLILEGEYRRNFENGGFTFGGSITQNDYDGSNRLRGHVETAGKFSIFENWVWGWNINFASDDGYLRRFDLSDADRLTSELFIQRYDDTGFLDGSALYFQSLRDGDLAGNIPKGVPVVEYRRDFQELVLEGDLGVFASGHVLARNSGRDATRLTLGADWEREEVLPWGLALTGFAEVRGDLFSAFDDATIRDDVTARLTGHVGAEARFPLIWDNAGEVQHIVEPIVQFIAAPYGGNDTNIPVEDSLAPEFDETNVIDTNHFSGLDNFEEGPRVNVLMRYERVVFDGLRFDASVGRTFRFRRLNAFSNGSGLGGTESDYVAAWQVIYDPYVQLNHRMRVENDGTVTRNEFFGEFTIDPVELTVSYGFYEADPFVGAVTDREEVTAEGAFQFDRNWSISAFLQRDLVVGEFVQVGSTITYSNECCEIDLFINRRFTDSTDAPGSTSVGVQIRLLTLGDPDVR